MTLDGNTLIDVVAMGELLIDFTSAGISSSGKLQFEANPGGAPANVVSCLSKLGKRTAFIGKIGKDVFGGILRSALEEQSILTDGLITDAHLNTTLAFVHIDGEGERSFCFYRQNCADIAVRAEEVQQGVLNASVFHFGSLSLTDEPARSATYFALNNLSRADTLVSYDPNLRLDLWENAEVARQRILEPLTYVNVLKLSSEELEFLVDTNDLALGSRELARRYGIDMIFVTMGAKGCFYRVGRHEGHVPAYRVKTVDSTGAGDGFLGGVIYQILEGRATMAEWSQDDIENKVQFANAVGALVTTRVGAFASMPTQSEVMCLMRSHE